MYSHCLFCHADLGRNEVLESLPIGRRIAFDHEKGRLWVVCRKCGRWNLTPFDAREDAIEGAERAFRGTRLRMSTDNIGLARMPDGTDLVRVGPALRPEMAAWRYGAQFGRRRRTALAVAAAGAVGGVAIWGTMLWSGVGLGFLWGGFNVRRGAVKAWERVNRISLPGEPGDTTPLRIETEHARRATLFRTPDDPALRLRVPGVDQRWVRFDERDTPGILGKVLPRANWQGGREADVQLALQILDSAAQRGGRDLLDAVTRYTVLSRANARPLEDLSVATRLALEMALHEDAERVALAGELLDLEAAWRQAEELAAIADAFVPSAAERALARLKDSFSAR